MQIIQTPLTLQSLTTMAKNRFGNLIKGVVDIEKGLLVLDADLHADEEALLISEGSDQKNLWGINLYPELFGTDDFIEFYSMINLRPSENHLSRGVDDPQIQKQIQSVITKYIKT